MKPIKKKTKRMLEVEKTRGADVEEVMRRLYVDENMPIFTLCDELSISYTTALSWLKQAGVYSRKLDLE